MTRARAASTSGFDIIGDIHGHATELRRLLKQLEYQQTPTGYRHETRKVIFLGDFIDRGVELKEHKELLNIVIPMVRNGHAHAVMGNHEFNALAYHTLHQGEYLRPHTEKNSEQHQAFLNEFEHKPELKQSILDFFYELPLWLDLGDLRAVHACWDKQQMELFKNIEGNRLTPELLIQASRKGTPAYEAIESLLKGVEIQLPQGITFKDKGNTTRSAVRVKWWARTATRFADILIEPNLNIGEAANLPAPELAANYGPEEPPCFIGHYWLTGTPEPLTSNIACLDYSAAAGGKLVAYRWSGEQVLTKANFIG